MQQLSDSKEKRHPCDNCCNALESWDGNQFDYYCSFSGNPDGYVSVTEKCEKYFELSFPKKKGK